jgi:hypothetical protein
MPKQNPNLLLVEGKDEQYTLPFLMDEYVVWGDKKEDRVVEIKEHDGLENLLRPGVIEAESKTPGLRSFGVIIDANDEFDSRWSRVRERCRRVAVGFPGFSSARSMRDCRSPRISRDGSWTCTRSLHAQPRSPNSAWRPRNRSYPIASLSDELDRPKVIPLCLISSNWSFRTIGS